MRRRCVVLLLGALWLSCLPAGAAWAQADGLTPSAQAAGRLPPAHGAPHLLRLPARPPAVQVYPVVPVPLADDGAIVSPSPAHTRWGYLRVEVRPEEAEIYVDGEFVGRGRDFSGAAVIPVAPGGHRLELRADELGSQLYLLVGAGEVVDIRRDLSPPRPDRSTTSSRRWSTPTRPAGRAGYR
jgi:hypothetical protein